jgi:hypothetical protein
LPTLEQPAIKSIEPVIHAQRRGLTNRPLAALKRLIRAAAPARSEHLSDDHRRHDEMAFVTRRSGCQGD